MSRKQTQSGCQLWPHQLLDGSWLMLTKQKQQANQHPGARYVSVRLPFCVGTAVPSESCQKFSAQEHWDRKKQLAKIKLRCTSVYVCCWNHVLNGRLEETSPKGRFRYARNSPLSKVIQATTGVLTIDALNLLSIP